ncbi:Lecithin-cholesterol acyltransferase [Spironucleus salmonicida]|nr:Lecithin-cholesterol acyltransferase [Spironucleus salmonicida]
MKPVILVPGVAGSKLWSQSTKPGSKPYYIWVPQNYSVSSLCKSIIKNMWGVTENGVFKSWQEYYGYATVSPVEGINGCYRLMDTQLTETKLASALHICYYFDYYVDYFISRGYTPGVNLFAYSYDWRQDVSNPIIQKPFMKLIKFAMSQNNNQKVSLIAHSMGGLVVKSFMIQNDWWKFIRRFCALTVPFDGSSGGVTACFFEGFMMNLPLPTNIGRGFESKCPGIAGLLPRDFPDYYGDTSTLINTPVCCCFGVERQQSIKSHVRLFYSSRKHDGLIIFENPTAEIEKVILDETVYGNQVPDVAFVILRHILTKNLVDHNLSQVIRTLQKSCKKGAVSTSESIYVMCSAKSKLQVFKTKFAEGPEQEDTFQFGTEEVVSFDTLNHIRDDDIREVIDIDGHDLQSGQITQNIPQFDQQDLKDLKFKKYTCYYFSKRQRNKDLCSVGEDGKLVFPPEILEFFNSGGFNIPRAATDQSLLIYAQAELMREEYLALKQAKIQLAQEEKPIQQLLSSLTVPGTLEHVLYETDLTNLDHQAKTVYYPQEDIDYKFISFSGSRKATSHHTFFDGGKSKFSYSSGDGLVLLPSALSDCTPEKFVVKRVVLPKCSHMMVKFKKDVIDTIFSLINE